VKNFYEYPERDEEALECAPHNWRALYAFGLSSDVEGY